MNAVLVESVGEFLDVIEPDLRRAEAENSLILGVLRRLRDDPAFATTDRILLLIKRSSQWVLAAAMIPPNSLMLGAQPRLIRIGGPMEALVEYLVSAKSIVPGVVATARIAEEFAEQWRAATGAAIRKVQRERIYAATSISHDLPQIEGRLRLATSVDLDLVSDWTADFIREALGETPGEEIREITRYRIERGQMYLWDSGRPVAMAGQLRSTQKTVTVNAVYTPPALRGRGYATAAVATLTAQLLAAGYESCVLYADQANPTSNGIYLRIGYRPVSDSLHLHFTDPTNVSG